MLLTTEYFVPAPKGGREGRAYYLVLVLSTWYSMLLSTSYSLLSTSYQLGEVKEQAGLVLGRQPQLGREQRLRLGERRRHDGTQRDL